MRPHMAVGTLGAHVMIRCFLPVLPSSTPHYTMPTCRSQRFPSASFRSQAGIYSVATHVLGPSFILESVTIITDAWTVGLRL